MSDYATSTAQPSVSVRNRDSVGAVSDRAVSEAAGILAALGGVIAAGIGAVLVKYVALPGLTFAFHRLWLGALLTSAIVVAVRGRLKLTRVRLAVPGGIALGLTTAFTFAALKETTVANTTIILALQPALMLVLVGSVTGERLKRGTTWLTLAAVAGVILTVYGTTRSPAWSLRGDFLAVCGLLMFTWYFAASKRARMRLGALEYQASHTLVATPVLVPIVLLSRQEMAVPDVATWGWIALLVIISGGGQFLINWAHRYTRLSLTSLLTVGIPVVSAIGAAVLLSEPLGVIQLAGMAMVLSSVGRLVYRSGRPVPPTAP